MEQQQKQLLVFGYGLPVIFGGLGLRHWRQHGFDAIAAALWAAAAIMLAITLFNPAALKIVLKHWMKAMHAIGTVITAVVLTVLFFTIFAAAGIILRLLRKDLLHTILAPKGRSYWIIRGAHNKDLAGYRRQF